MTHKTSDKAIVREITEVLAAKGVQFAVISPGSRNAPLIISFTQHVDIKSFSVIDERSAGYFALGLALRTNSPVAIICTSGTAVLNLAPALAEAFYQQVPLITITADRPAEWIHQADGQAIQQQNIFSNYVKASWQLPVGESASDIWYANRIANEAVNLCLQPARGPVHLNVPLREPLYGQADSGFMKVRIIQNLLPQLVLSENQKVKMRETVANARRIMILCGTLHASKRLEAALSRMAEWPSVVVLTETTSNIFGPHFRSGTDRMITSMSAAIAQHYQPDLLIAIGTNIVSKRIKTFLREFPPSELWTVDTQQIPPDTFQALTHHFVADLPMFFETLESMPHFSQSHYAHDWNLLDEQTASLHNQLMETIPWSDLKAFHHIFSHIPESVNIHLGNSTPVRYAQFFGVKNNNQYYSNRGTSGIDGCVSTAVGYAYGSQTQNWLLIGDVSFIYDSNGLWNKYVGGNFRMIIMNNQGGGIFRYIPGPDSTPVLEEYFETTHQTHIATLIKAFGFESMEASNEAELVDCLNVMSQPSEKALILIVNTPRLENASILKNYFNKIKPVII